MGRIRGRRALITGASAGIGEACAHTFAEAGADLVLVARREARLERLARTLVATHGTTVRTFVLDVRDREAIDAMERSLSQSGELPDVLINNAGLGRGLAAVHEGSVQDWDEMIDTNIKGLLYVTRRFLPTMVERDRGHIVNIGSSAGWMVYPRGNVYNATKFAVRALTQAISVDLLGTSIRVSSIDPAITRTEFAEVRFRGDAERADGVYEGYRPLDPEDVADAALYAVSAPDHVNILHVIMHPVAQRNAYLLDRTEAP